MKTILYILVILFAIMQLAGWTIIFLIKKDDRKRKTGYAMVAAGGLLMAAFFLYLLFN